MPPRGKSALPVSKSSSAFSLKTPYGTAPKKVSSEVISKNPLNGRVLSDAPRRACVQRLMSNQVSLDTFSRTRFQRFLSNPPCTSFKKLIILTLRLIQSLRTMSVVKAVPGGIKDKECIRFALRERPPVPYVLEKDPVQETVPALKSNQSLKTTIGEDLELRISIWHTGMSKAFSMHVSTALDAIKKQGTFKVNKEAVKAYVEQHEDAVKQAKAALALLTAPTSKGKKTSKKSSNKSPEKALQKTKEGAASYKAPAPDLCKKYQADYDKAYFVKETAKNKREASGTKMFQFYANLLS
jgi:hypothetical protein